jgi:23S rRNA (guanosine2251-2'-O)-methyltransferase
MNKNNYFKDENQEQTRNYIYGFNTLLVSLQAKKSKLEKLYLTNEALRELEEALNCPIKAQICTLDEIDRILYKAKIQKEGRINHQGAVGVFAKRSPVSAANLANLSKILILDKITDIGNIGTLTRSMALFGFEAIVYPSHKSPDLLSPNIYHTIAKISSGGAELIDFYQSQNLVRDIKFLQENGFKCTAMDVNANADAQAPSTTQNAKIALILGSENAGVSKNILEIADGTLHIPMSPNAIQNGLDSLNVAVSGTLGMYVLTSK